MARHDNNDNSALGCAFTLIVLVFAMPLFGYKLYKSSIPEEKAVGIVLMIVGFILWIALLLNM